MGKDYSTYIKAHIDRNRHEREELEHYRRRVMDGIRQAAPRWAQKYGVNRVLLFGSFAKGTQRFDSDVDIAVEGLKGRDYWKAWSDLEKISGLRVDVRCLTDFPAPFRELILKTGVLIYEKGTDSDTDR